MDEKVGYNPNHKCLCKDTHPGLGPHRDCKERGFHLCGCGKRSTLTEPDKWITTASSILYDEAHRKDTGHSFFKGLEEEIRGASAEAESMLGGDAIDNFIAKGFLEFVKGLVETPLERVIRMLNEIQQKCAVKEHYHAHHSSKKGLIHMCFMQQGTDEEECAKLASKVMIALDLASMDLIHVGGTQPAYHSSHVEMDGLPSLGVHIDPIRRN